MRTNAMTRAALALILAAGAAGAGAVGAAEPTLDEIIAKHIEAHGGAARWKAVKSLKMTGTMSSWSRTGPFTLVRTGDGKYHLDGIQDDKKLIVGWDGTQAWWDNRFLQEGAQPIRGTDLAVIQREFDLPTPFFSHKERGYEVKLRGREDFEGRPAIALEVKRQDGLDETWYLDPGTHLEMGRESPGSDFGRPVPQHTFFEDFRTVSGLVIPFHVESQWYTRERSLRIEKVEVDVPVDDAVFRKPPPTGMGPLLPLAGEWSVAVQRRDNPVGPFQDASRESRIEALLGGALLQETYTSTEGAGVVRSITYDRFRKRYRVSEVNETQTYMDLLEGDFDDQKHLVVHNTVTNTPSHAFGMTIHSRLRIADITEDGFRTEEEFSIDGGKQWKVFVKSVYTRRK
jgi:hypothetical protein